MIPFCPGCGTAAWMRSLPDGERYDCSSCETVWIIRPAHGEQWLMSAKRTAWREFIRAAHAGVIMPSDPKTN